MLTILIAEDEKNIRAGIRKILGEHFSAEIREAKNGEEAFQIFAGEKIDILITDIRMPQMDGIELMSRICESPAPPIMIVLSGYDEFSYAQKACAFGAQAYIMKPIDKPEFIGAVSKSIAKLKNAAKQAVEDGIRDILNGSKGYDIPLDISPARPFYFVFILAKKGTMSEVMRLETVFSNEHYTIERRENRILALVDERERQNLETRDFHGKLCLVFSAPCFQAFDFAEGYRQARTACFYRFFRDDSVFHYRKPERDIDRVPGHARLQELQDLVEHLRFFPSQAITERVNALFSFGGSGGSQGEYLALLHEYFILHITNLYREHIADNMYLTLTMKMLADAPCFSSLEDFKKRIVNIMLCLNQRFRKNSSRYAFIDAALDWIHQHFTENINMSLTANQVSVNYTYFSEKFKEHTGSNFNEYLKMLRIAKAKKLLKQGFYKVYEVAQRSGYNDVKYFLKSFKEITGVSPGEYQRAANHESSNP